MLILYLETLVNSHVKSRKFLLSFSFFGRFLGIFYIDNHVTCFAFRFFFFFKSSPEDILIDSRERGKGRRERNINARETSIDCVPHTPQLGPNP